MKMLRKLLNIMAIPFISLQNKSSRVQNNLGYLPNTYLVKYCSHESDSFSVSIKTVKILKEKEKIVLIDVRNTKEFEFGHSITGSINIPLLEVEHALNYLTDEEFQMKYGVQRPLLDTPIVFICQFGIRSSLAQKSALELGYNNVKFSKISV